MVRDQIEPWTATITQSPRTAGKTASDTADPLMPLLTLVFVLVSFIPDSDPPRYVPVYRLIWRDHYTRQCEDD